MIDAIARHRSIRNYLDKPIEPEILNEILAAGTRASTIGNMQLYSLVVSTSKEMRNALAPCHFNQPMVTQAPVVVTCCADIHRFSLWCRQRNAEPRYDNFAWFVSAAIDTLMAAENVALEAEAHGLGICVLGTTIYTADKIVETLGLPIGVIPITTLVIGYPADQPPLTDRLPLEAVVHHETYHDYDTKSIDKIWAEREASDETQELLKVNDLPNLARIFTEKRYTANDNLLFSRKYFEVLKKQGFFNQ